MDVDQISAGQTIPVEMSADDYFLVPPDQDPPAEHGDDAAYFKIFLDSVESTPLIVTASIRVNVTIPPATPPGNHKLACRIFKHDGTPTDVITEISIKVVVGGSGTGGSTSTGGMTSTGGDSGVGGGGMTSTGGTTSTGGVTSATGGSTS